MVVVAYRLFRIVFNKNIIVLGDNINPVTQTDHYNGKNRANLFKINE
jgi:hypothetical protein